MKIKENIYNILAGLITPLILIISMRNNDYFIIEPIIIFIYIYFGAYKKNHYFANSLLIGYFISVFIDLIFFVGF